MLIYKIRNVVNGNWYVGATHNLKRRWGGHVREAFAGRNGILGRAIRKYGENAFRLDVVIDNIASSKEMFASEVFAIALYKLIDGAESYNMTKGGEGVSPGTLPPITGKHHAPESNEKNRQAHLGKVLTPEHRERISKGVRGMRWTDESKAKWKGHKKSPETKAKMQNMKNTLGKHWKLSEETKRRQSAAAIIREQKKRNHGIS
jgi:group I intron endonuclease